MSRVVPLEARAADYILQNCPGRTDEALMDRFGISYNTFRKIERGEAIRASLADRLTRRLWREMR